MTRIRILIVDDEPQLLRALRINLQARQYDVVTAADGTSALRAAADRHLDVVVAGRPPGAAAARVGPTYVKRATTCASTWASCGVNWRPARRARGTC
ncbi:hypothetical protein [Dactylosporangium sp. CA-233914]|uniref:hypothetical protein n=1 Tax=Dactylosporangium sp. CA-233914 TaxID=3239934 RepID=UPI003D92480E